MTDIEILEEMEPEEFARAVKKECVFHVDENCVETWVIRLVYEDGSVKYVRNLAVPLSGQHPIIQKIEAFTDYGPAAGIAGFTFDHIVLGDFNLGDGHIKYCLSNEAILGWLKQQIAEFDEEHEMQFPLYWANRIRDAACIISFLHELWSIPYRERMEAEESEGH